MNVRPQLGGKDNPLSNEKVRQAMNYAANKEAIIQVVTHNVGSPLTSFMSSATPLHAGDKPLYPYRRREGEEPDEGSRLRERLRDRRCWCSPATRTRSASPPRCSRCGARSASSSSCSRSTTPAAPSNIATAPSRCAFRRWTDDIADPNEITSYFVYSPTIDALHSGWKSEEADKLFEASQKEIDAEKRAEQYAKMQEIFNASGPTIPLYETPYPVALSKKVHGFLQIPLGNNIFGAAWLEK